VSAYAGRHRLQKNEARLKKLQVEAGKLLWSMGASGFIRSECRLGSGYTFLCGRSRTEGVTSLPIGQTTAICQ
jgi:hypothetical protein